MKKKYFIKLLKLLPVILIFFVTYRCMDSNEPSAADIIYNFHLNKRIYDELILFCEKYPNLGRVYQYEEENDLTKRSEEEKKIVKEISSILEKISVEFIGCARTHKTKEKLEWVNFLVWSDGFTFAGKAKMLAYFVPGNNSDFLKQYTVIELYPDTWYYWEDIN